MRGTVIQVPIDKKLRDQAMVAATNMGFSSLQESIRVFLAKLARQEIIVSFVEKPIKLSTKAIKRYNQMLDEVEDGKVKLFKAESIDALMSHLTTL